MTKPTLTPEQYNAIANTCKVRCDKCGWVSDNMPFMEVKEWHTKACPSCKAYPVVESLDLWETAKQAIEDIYTHGKISPETLAATPKGATCLAGDKAQGLEASDIAPEFFPDKPRPKEVH